jgi:hypothetical protein
MNTRVLLTASAVGLGAAGLAGSFLPHELLALTNVGPSGVLPLLVQLLGALFLAFAITNWISRGSLIGGIYNRAVAMGNLMHFTIGALTLTKAVFASDRSVAMMIVATIYVVFALAFARVAFGSPVMTAAVDPNTR